MAKGNILLCRPFVPYETHNVVERQPGVCMNRTAAVVSRHLLFPASGCRLLLASVRLLEEELLPGSAR